MEPVFRNLSSTQLADQIRTGNRLVQAAALATVGRRLSIDHLPLVIELTASEDRVMQRAAFLALREFGDPKAIRLLSEYARGKEHPVATLAFECLASSRFEAAHLALATLLEEDLVVSPVEQARILADYPRAEWIDVLTEYATGRSLDTTLTPEDVADLRQDALLALGRIGHPELVDLLASALNAEASSVRETAFSLLLTQQNPHSDQVALDFALERMETEFPSPQMLTLFERLPDQRAIPLLVKHFQNGERNKNQVIKALARIGGAGIDHVLADQFTSLEKREQAAVLNSLNLLRSPHAVRLSGDAIRSSDSVLFNAAISVLQTQATPGAIAVLRDALVEATDTRSIRATTRALVEIGNHDAVYALRHARIHTEDADKREQIAKSLRGIENRSPGVHALNLAKQHAGNEDWENALEDYDIAISIDPELTTAYSGRGHCHLQLEQLDAAIADYRAVLKRNPDDGLSITGLSIVLVRKGKIEEGLEFIQDKQARFKDDVLFAYNSACVYGRAIEMTLMQEASPEQEEQVLELQSQGIEQLRLSLQLGFRDLRFMKRDPDLATLRELPEFKNLKAKDVIEGK